MYRFFHGCRVFTGADFVSGLGVLVTDGRVAGLRTEAEVPPGSDAVVLPADAVLAPGFLDLQVNGAGGVLFNGDPSAEGALAVARAVRASGVTGILPTFITDAREGMARAAEAAVVAAAVADGGVLGIHLEGPFISAARCGIHDPSFIRLPDDRDDSLLAATARALEPLGGRVLLTVAPEAVGETWLARMASHGIVLSAGHTEASFERMEAAFRSGVRGVTHLTNAMPEVRNRAPGPVAAALAARDVWCGLIADGHHVHPGLMRVFAATKTPGRLFLVTDAMPPVGTEDDGFVLNGRSILRREGRLVSAEGVLAGADIDMAGAVRNAVEMIGLPLGEALRMASLYPAAFLRLDHERGRIAPGFRADFVALDGALRPLSTWIGGTPVWRRAQNTRK